MFSMFISLTEGKRRKRVFLNYARNAYLYVCGASQQARNAKCSC